MKIEHFAFNVKDPVAVSEWYTKNLGMTVARKMDKAPFTHFLADNSGKVMIEIYNNPVNEVPDYANMNPLLVHLAFVSKNPDDDKQRLISAGATFVEEARPDQDSLLVMMRDPWGFAIQFCKRSTPMI